MPKKITKCSCFAPLTKYRNNFAQLVRILLLEHYCCQHQRNLLERCVKLTDHVIHQHVLESLDFTHASKFTNCTAVSIDVLSSFPPLQLGRSCISEWQPTTHPSSSSQTRSTADRRRTLLFFWASWEQTCKHHTARRLVRFVSEIYL